MINFSVGGGYTIHTHFHMVCSACGISHGCGTLIIVGMIILTRYVSCIHYVVFKIVTVWQNMTRTGFIDVSHIHHTFANENKLIVGRYMIKVD